MVRTDRKRVVSGNEGIAELDIELADKIVQLLGEFLYSKPRHRATWGQIADVLFIKLVPAYPQSRISLALNRVLVEYGPTGRWAGSSTWFCIKAEQWLEITARQQRLNTRLLHD